MSCSESNAIISCVCEFEWSSCKLLLTCTFFGPGWSLTLTQSSKYCRDTKHMTQHSPDRNWMKYIGIGTTGTNSHHSCNCCHSCKWTLLPSTILLQAGLFKLLTSSLMSKSTIVLVSTNNFVKKSGTAGRPKVLLGSSTVGRTWRIAGWFRISSTGWTVEQETTTWRWVGMFLDSGATGRSGTAKERGFSDDLTTRQQSHRETPACSSGKRPKITSLFFLWRS
jgi:hypothetical protein